MVFGFGFNRARVLASAERNVKAGKLGPAISDYEKLLRHDPNDLSSLNTLGDLYTGKGDLTRAATCFKQVALAYASAGQPVKAIAIYRKLVRHSPSSSALVQLADLYALQHQVSEARAHYVAAAELLAESEPASAAGVLHKALELDPDNAQVFEHLAALLEQLDKKTELRDLHLRSAQTLRRRRQPAECEQALAHVLRLDPTQVPALLLAAELRLEAGDAAAAIGHLGGIADLDWRPEALRLMLRAQLLRGAGEEAAATSVRLLTQHKDPSGFTALSEWATGRGDHPLLLRLYQRHAGNLLQADGARFAALLDALAQQARDDGEALESIAALLERTGVTAPLVRALGLLALIEKRLGRSDRACGIYERLAALQPDDPSHVENCRLLREQGEAAASEAQPHVEASVAEEPETAPEPDREDLLIGDDEFTPPPVSAVGPEQAALESALTEADLFAAYRLPEKAILTLETARPLAPRDLRLHHELAGLYAQVGRHSDAARSFALLAELCTEQGHESGVTYYLQCAAHHRQETERLERALTAPDAEPTYGAPLALLTDPPAPGLRSPLAALPECLPEPIGGTVAGLDDLLDEARFYLAQGMNDETASALERAAELAPGHAAIAALRQCAAAMPTQAAPVELLVIPPHETAPPVRQPRAAAKAAPHETAVAAAVPEPAPPAMPSADDLGLFSMASARADSCGREAGPLETSLLDVEHTLLAADPAGVGQDGDDLLADLVAPAFEAPAAVDLYGEDEYFDWPADSEATPVSDEARLREVDPRGDFAALFTPPANLAPPRAQRRRRP